MTDDIELIDNPDDPDAAPPSQDDQRDDSPKNDEVPDA